METHNETKASNRDRQSAKSQLLEELVKGLSTEQDLFGPSGLFTELKGALMERLLEAEMTEHLGHERQERRRGSNVRNGHSAKTVETESGPVEIRVPRDREGSFDPKLVPKGQRRLEGFDEKVIALYSRGMSTRDIQRHLRELYGTDVSPDPHLASHGRRDGGDASMASTSARRRVPNRPHRRDFRQHT